MKIDVVELTLRRSHTIEIDIPESEEFDISTAAAIFCKEIGPLNVQHVAMLSLDHANRLCNYFTVSVGSVDEVRVSLAQMFRCALLSNASSIIIAHNHPTGKVSVTSKDIEMTKRIAFFATAFSINLIDSLVVTADQYTSIRAHCKEFTHD